MKRPPFLSGGDKIGIVATARKITPAEIQPAADLFKSWGLEVVFSENLFGEEHQYSGSDEQRAADLQDMLNDAAVKALISARGGYGTLRIIDRIDFSGFKKNPKWVIGYSDITVLHSHIHNIGIESLHAVMPVNFQKDRESVETLRKALFGEPLNYEYAEHTISRKGDAEAVITGGNLSLLYALTASPDDIDTSGKILFIEDVDEYLYHIDRMMMNLKRSGKLKKLAGLIVGGMSDMKDNAVPFGKTAEEIIADAVKEYDYPVCFNFPAGHTLKNFALPLGRKVRLHVGNKVSLKFL